MGVIYKITNSINGKTYIGKTTRTMQRRWIEHKTAAKSDAEEFDNIVLYKALRKYEIENFVIEPIEQNINILEINEREKYWIKHLNTLIPNGYNMTIGGEGISLFDYEEIQNLWLKNNLLTQKEIALMVGCGLSTVARALKSLPEYADKYHKKVLQFDLNNNFIAEYFSTRVAAKEFFNNIKCRSVILSCCNETHYSAYGYRWHYKDTDPKNYKVLQTKEIKCLETEKIYKNISEAARDTKIDRKSINRCILKQSLSAGKLHWSYADEIITIEQIEKNRKFTNGKKIVCIETQEIFPSIKKAKEKYNGDIQACLAGRQKVAAGYHWKFIEE